MFIEFETLKFKNFLSFGNVFTEIALNSHRKTVILGKNGHGKSTILCALTYVLFGKPFRKINKPNIINSINKKDCVVELTFSIGDRKYKVIRGMKPSIFEIYQNGILLNQDASISDYQDHFEKNIIKTNYKSFTQVVILGSARYTPFMQLTSSDRRAIVEDLLDIQIFTSMNVIVKDKLNKIKDAYSNLTHEIEIEKLQIVNKKSILKETKKKADFQIETKNQQILEYKTSIKECENSIKELEAKIAILSDKISDKKTFETKKKKLLSIESKLEENVKNIAKDIEFFNANNSCPVCMQEIENSFKETRINSSLAKKEEFDVAIKKLSDELLLVDDKLTDISNALADISDLQNKISSYVATVKSYTDFIDTINLELQEINSVDNDYSEILDQISKMISEYDAKVNKKDSLLDTKKYLEYCATLLKDGGIKTKIVKQYLPVLNKLINDYLTKMEFFVNFNINESFEEVIKSRHRDEFQYNNFSEGEKLKIDISLLMAFRDLSKLKNSVNCNLLLLDEIIDGALDEAGINLFLDMIDDMGYNTNIFVISHRSDEIRDRFDRSLKFEKVKNFSRIKVV